MHVQPTESSVGLSILVGSFPFSFLLSLPPFSLSLSLSLHGGSFFRSVPYLQITLYEDISSERMAAFAF